MKDLPELRQRLTSRIRPIDGADLRIPISLKRTLCKKWKRAIEPENGGIRLQTQKGNEHLTDVDLLKAAYAGELVKELHAYKSKFKEYLKLHDITQKTSEELKASTNPQNTPSWWDKVEISIRSDSTLTEENKDKLIRFAIDNDWSGCTKGSGRGDFFISSVVNACLSNVTHNSMLGDVAKDLIDLGPEIAPILDWHNGSIATVNFGHNHVLILLEQFSEQTKELYCSLLKSSLTKPFVILTGASGTGKTQLATSLAKYLSNAEGTNSAVVAVGADWTDNRNVLGFVNHLRTIKADGTELPIYQSTPILDLILEASEEENADVPYFLILDEMNLSHVERYFADFLSAMERGDGVLELHKEGEARLPRNEDDATGVPHQIAYPKNLFVVGTVNIDETTYMFSPKVLDRANVIEFTVSDAEIEKFLNDPKPYIEPDPAKPGVAEGFLALAKQARAMEGVAFKGNLPEEVSDHLLDLFKILQVGHFEFAYRTAKEINIYLKVCRHLAGEDAEQKAWDKDGWKSDLDDQILQKLLPKLHGSVSRIDTLLANLADYCHSGEYKEDGKVQPDAVLQLEPKAALFGKSLKKLQTMLRTLKAEQFVSFIQ
ncbi:MAG: McrB family protein [Coraliomargarita sp.]